jgi:AraC-like DNA-binding protein
MRSHLDVTYDLDDLIDELGLDKSYFVRLFKKSIAEIGSRTT